MPDLDNEPRSYEPGNDERASKLRDMSAFREPPSQNPEGQPSKTQKAQEKPATSELRFTLPHRSINPSTSGARPNDKIDANRTKSELQAATEQLATIHRRIYDSKKAKDYATASELAYHAVPEMVLRIEKLKQDLLKQSIGKEKIEKASQDLANQAKDKEGKVAEKQNQVPRTAIESDSDSSEGSGDRILVEDMSD